MNIYFVDRPVECLLKYVCDMILMLIMYFTLLLFSLIIKFYNYILLLSNSTTLSYNHNTNSFTQQKNKKYSLVKC